MIIALDIFCCWRKVDLFLYLETLHYVVLVDLLAAAGLLDASFNNGSRSFRLVCSAEIFGAQ